MRIVITGATGNVGTSLLDVLAAEERVQEIVGIARRLPKAAFAKTTFVDADVRSAALEPLFAGADVVVHLAWRIRSSHDEHELTSTNVEGSRRVFEASARAGVRALVYASSVGAYSPGPAEPQELVGESWPVRGVKGSIYSQHKAAVERVLDDFEARQPAIRVVRLRPALIFKRSAAAHIRELFLGPLVPRWLFDERFVKVVPEHPRFRFQAVHASDVADAYRRAIVGQARGAFNIAAWPILDSEKLAGLFRAKRVRVGPRALRTLAAVTFRLHLQPAEPGWIDLCFSAPMLDCSRALGLLDWAPRMSGVQALLELFDGLRQGSSFDTPPLAAPSLLSR